MLVERCGQPAPAGPKIAGACRLTPKVSDDHGELVRVSPMVLERCVQLVPIARIGHVCEGRLAGVDGVVVQMDESIEKQDDILNHPYHGQGSPAPCVKRSACLGEGRVTMSSVLQTQGRAGPNSGEDPSMNRTNIDDPQKSHRAHEHAATSRAERAQTAEHDHGDDARLKTQIARLREAGRNLGEQIDGQVRKRPYVALGAAAGVGFVAGSLFGSRLGQVLLAAGIGYAAKHALGADLGLGLDRIHSALERLTREAARSSGSA
jgi:ElaB/YqjD/DUF883 family membrane-anchored ribosome-binding protein